MTFRFRLFAVALAVAAVTAAPAAAQSFYSAIRVQVTPRDAQVFLDGEFVGIVDDFDGALQGIRTFSGEHEIEIYLEGYRSVRRKLFLAPGRTFQMKHTLAQLKPGEPADPVPAPPQRPATRDGRVRERLRERPGSAREYGSISIRAQPDDAEVFIDGERWSGMPGEPLVVEVPAGIRHVEIRRPGRQSYSTDIDVRPGETRTLNVSLRAL